MRTASEIEQVVGTHSRVLTAEFLVNLTKIVTEIFIADVSCYLFTFIAQIENVQRCACNGTRSSQYDQAGNRDNAIVVTAIAR